MAITQLAPPYPVFTDKSGAPLDNGYLYFGVASLNPETNPIQVYYDINLTQPAAQPLRTSNGYVMRNGSPALIYANDPFSVTVRDKNGEFVIYSPVGYGIAPGSATGSGSSLSYDTFSGDGVTVDYTLTSSVLVGTAADIYIDGVYQSKDNYSITGGVLTFSTAPPFLSEIEVVAAGVNNIGGTNASNVVFNAGLSGSINRSADTKMAEVPSVLDFGAIGDGVTDDTDAFTAAWATVNPQAVYVPDGSYAITGTVTGKFFSFGAVTVVGGTVTTITDLLTQQSSGFDSNPTFDSVTVNGTLSVDQIAEKTSAAGIDLDGVTLKDGNVVLADGSGIDFSATPGSGTSELLDDYQEGTWTPTLTTDATDFTSVTYDGLTSGFYTKIGNIVHISGTLRTDAITLGSASGTVLIGGLPFTASAPTAVAIGSSSGWNINHPSAGEVRSGTTALALLYRASANGEATNVAPADCRTTGDSNLLRFSAAYQT